MIRRGQMLDGVVNIESTTNKSFGTGFVIDKDANGVYILTCKHVLDDVITPVVEDQEAKVVAQGDFIDLAVVYVKTIQLEPFSLTITPCREDKVKVIGFSSFDKSVNQKSHIQATLYKEVVELHSTKDDSYYRVRKIQASEGYTFDRGNSGSPVICEKTGEVIAVISNKEGSRLAYAVDISYLKDIWTDMPLGLLKTSKPEYLTETVGLMGSIGKNKRKLSKNISKQIKRYVVPITALISFSLGGYLWMNPSVSVRDYKVINIPENEILPVRVRNVENSWKIGELDANAHNINVIKCDFNDKNQKWCRIQYGNIKGWVEAQYIIVDRDEFSEHPMKKVMKKNKPINEENDNVRLTLDYPASVKRGDIILLKASLKNEGAFESSGGITLSFPQRPLLQYTELSNTFQVLKKYKIGHIVYNNHKKQADKMEAIHPVIESQEVNWTKGEAHYFSIALKTPKELNRLKIRVRGALTLDRVVPSEGMVDQQSFASKEIVIQIIE